MRDWGKIAVGTRLEKMVESRFFTAWSELITTGLRPGDGYLVAADLPAHKASNYLVRKFLESPCDTLLFLDSDADVGREFIESFRSVEAGWGYDILQAFYTRRGWPPEAIWYEDARDGSGRLATCLVTGDDPITRDVAAVGTHACLMRRHVFEGLAKGFVPDAPGDQYDWFFYPRHKNVSEDIAFSKEARKAGFKLGATTAVKAGHISRVTTGWDTYIDYLRLSGRTEDLARRRELAVTVAGVTGESPESVLSRSYIEHEDLRTAWASAPHETPQQVRDFYSGDGGRKYLYELIGWNASPQYLEMIEPLRHYRNKRALVIGSGIGGEVDALIGDANSVRNAVHAYDLPGPLRDFTKARFNGKVTHLEGDTLPQALKDAGGKYDLVVAIDVLEHIHPSEFRAALDAIGQSMPRGGTLFAHANWGERNKYPMHYDNAGEFLAWTVRERLVKEGPHVWRKSSA